MCQEVQTSDVPLALLDYCDAEQEDEHIGADALIARSAKLPEEDKVEAVTHARDHARRAKRLVDTGDEDAASIHQALLANMARVAR